ncbi:MAG: hypothetical protein IPK60_06140 [Sandaracinaceae bacterium]|nr:hypothetical protein [Sandaracinaceae bacterium]
MSKVQKNFETETALIAPEPAQGELKPVPVAWEALEDAFENNAPEVHSYLQLSTGEVIRVVDGIADPTMHARIAADAGYLRVDPVSSREQYRWMERYIETVEEGEFRSKLMQAIDGKGAFRRFKDVLMNFPVERERWFTFRSERLRTCMEAWLNAHGIEATERPQWEVPSVDAVRDVVEREVDEKPNRKPRAATADAQRGRLREYIETLPARELETAIAFIEFLRERKHTPRVRDRAEGSVDRDGVLTPDDSGPIET